MQSPEQPGHLLERNYAELSKNSWTLCNNFLGADFFQALLLECQSRELKEGGFRPSLIGKGSDRHSQTLVRSDDISWVDFEDDSLSSQHLKSRLETLCQDLNENLYLGIDHFEAHFAKYENGALYKTHIDQSTSMAHNDGARVISFVIYLNTDWQLGNGGELQIEMPGQGNILIEPSFGTMILFRSDTVPHSVLESQKLRRSLTGWLRKSKVSA